MPDEPERPLLERRVLGNNALVRTVRQTASPSGSATTPWAMTCAGPLAGEKPRSACRAAPEGTKPNSEKTSDTISTIGVAIR